MPNRWAIQSGNWSNPTTWSGSLIPTASDDVYANSFTVDVDTSFQVLTLRTSPSGSVITGGGVFRFSSGSVSGSITAATPFISGNNLTITVTAESGLVRLIFSSGSNISNGSGWLTHSGNCDLNIEGNPNILNPFASNGGFIINKGSTGTLTITGSVLFTTPFGAGGSNCRIINNSAGNVIIKGNVQGPTRGGSGNTSIFMIAGNLVVDGDVTGTTTSSTTAISFTGQTLIVNGTIRGGSTGFAISTGGDLTIISGSVIASSSPAIVNQNASSLNIFTGPFTNVSGTMAIQCVNAVLIPTANTLWDYENTILYSPNQLSYYPSASDVRHGISYVDGTVTGSLRIPPPTAVIAGVFTDNTTGSAILTTTQLQNAMWNRAVADMVETGSIGHRLSKSSTPASVGTQVASYLL